MTDKDSRHVATSPHEVKGTDNGKGGQTDNGKDRPGPADHGGQGGMATREVAPDLGDEGAPEPPD